MCEFIVFSDLILMNLFYCKTGDHHQMRVSTGFSAGSSPSVTFALANKCDLIDDGLTPAICHC